MIQAAIDWPSLEREALRLHARYSREIVEAVGLCPWAEQARIAGHVHTHVSPLARADVAQTAALVDALARDARTEVGFIVFPLLDLPRRSFAHFAADVRAANEASHPAGETVFALADFHPCAEPNLETPERLVPFLRRTPDPTLQLIRRSALHGVRMGAEHGTSFVDVSQLTDGLLDSLPSAPPPLAARVAQHNLRTVQRLGPDALVERFASILADRHASYFKLGLPLPLWKAHT